MDVGVRGRGHLQALHLGSPDVREEDGNLGSFHAGETLHRRRTRVSARGRENENAPSAGGVLHENRQHRQRHILERARLAVEQLQNLQAVGIDERNRIGLRETREKPVNRRGADILRQIVEKTRHHIFFASAQIIQTGRSVQLPAGGGKHRHIQSAVGSKSLKHALGARRLEAFSCRYEFHFDASAISSSFNMATPACPSAFSATLLSANLNTKTALPPLWKAKA